MIRAEERGKAILSHRPKGQQDPLCCTCLSVCQGWRDVAQKASPQPPRAGTRGGAFSRKAQMASVSGLT